jgi:hypothetical protein
VKARAPKETLGSYPTGNAATEFPNGYALYEDQYARFCGQPEAASSSDPIGNHKWKLFLVKPVVAEYLDNTTTKIN